MRSLFLFALVAIPTAVFAVEDNEKFEAYKQRRAERRVYALEARRNYNAASGPHVYRTAIAAPAPITPFIAIQEGWVAQGAIPVRPWITVGFPTIYHDVAPVQAYQLPTGYTHLASRRVIR